MSIHRLPMLRLYECNIGAETVIQMVSSQEVAQGRGCIIWGDYAIIIVVSAPFLRSMTT